MRTIKAVQPDSSRTKTSQRSKSKPSKRKGPTLNASALLRAVEKSDEAHS